MRNRFDQQLERLHVEMIQMGALCEDAIAAAAEALIRGDEALARSFARQMLGEIRRGMACFRQRGGNRHEC